MKTTTLLKNGRQRCAGSATCARASGANPTCRACRVYRSCKHIYAQVIDDVTGRTLAHASSTAKATLEPTFAGKNKTERAAVVGAEIAKARERGRRRARRLRPRVRHSSTDASRRSPKPPAQAA